MAALAQTALATLRTDATDPRERGRVAGAALAARAALCLDAYLPLFAGLGHSRDDVRRFGATVLARTARWHAPLAEELEAFALAAQLELELVAALNGRTELLALAECTTVGRTAGPEGPWLAQNWDWYADAPERCVVWSAAVEGARFATMTEAGILAKVGVSTRGIAVALNILYHERDGRGELGVPVHLVLRRLLGEAASVGDAWELLRDTPFSASSCITVVDAAGAVRTSSSRPRARPGSSRRRAGSHTATTSSTPSLRAARRSSPPTGCRGRRRVSLPPCALRRMRSPTGLRCSPPTIPIRRRSAGTTSRPVSPARRSWAPSSPSRCVPASPSCAWPRDSRASARSSTTPCSGQPQRPRRQAPRTSGGTAGQSAWVAPRSRQPTPRRQLKRSATVVPSASSKVASAHKTR